MLNVLNPFNFFLKDAFTSFSLNLFFFPHSSQNSVSIVSTSGNGSQAYPVESPEGYVAYSKAATVTVSKAKPCMILIPLLNSSKTHCLFLFLV